MKMRECAAAGHRAPSDTRQVDLPVSRVITRSPSSKVLARHLERLAIVYVRQSSTRQVTENIESTQLQYRLRERAVALGWPEARVLVIDDDLGVSGQSAEGRVGFQRLLAEVSLDHVGIILGIEMSRLARSCRDWHQLLDLCAVFGTLLADADGVYDPRDYNDRLLLGLKGTMSEAELHILRGRLEAGKLNKARRGDYFNNAPIGYRREGDSFVLEPDEQARAVVTLIFEKFAELGSATAVLRYLNAHGLRVGIRDHQGPARGQLTWKRPNIATLQNMLHHPIYSGAYVYGRRTTDPRRRVAGKRGSGRAYVPADQWQVLIHDRLPAYITWEQYQANQQKLRENSTRFGGGAPRGAALLAGRVVCGRCGKRMNVAYAGRVKARFVCDQDRNHLGLALCQSLNAQPLEELVTQQLLISLQPASLELSLQAAGAIEHDRQGLEQQHVQSVERAKYEADRAWRQYTAVEPENRLVARDLERRWEAALEEQRRAAEQLDRFRAEQPARLTESQRQRIRALATDIPALWSADSTKTADRQMILRTLVERIEVTVVKDTERVEVKVCWAGGYESRHEIRRSVRSYSQLEDHKRIVARVLQLREQGCSHGEVAQQLNAEDYHAPQGREFTDAMARLLWRRSRGLPRAGSEPKLPKDHWTAVNLATRLGTCPSTLNTWRRRGWVHARRLTGRWIYWAPAAEQARLKKLRVHPHRPLVPLPKKLTTPIGPAPW
jgi:DNA invertase Pin-like site-specific DNA recombinase